MMLVWLWGGLYWILFLSVYLLSFKKLSQSWVNRVIHFWAKISLKILRIEVDLKDSRPFLEQKPRVIICNHQSALDLFWGALICPPKPLVIGKKEIKWIPILNLIWWAMECIFIDRSNPQRAIASLTHVADVIVKESRSLFLAPEGTRTRDGKILPFKKGAFHIAVQAQVPIYPVVVAGAFELMKKGDWYPKPGKIKIEILPPIDTQGLTIQDVTQLTQRTQKLMSTSFIALNQVKH